LSKIGILLQENNRNIFSFKNLVAAFRLDKLESIEIAKLKTNFL